jgi:hypothetical protein
MNEKYINIFLKKNLNWKNLLRFKINLIYKKTNNYLLI